MNIERIEVFSYNGGKTYEYEIYCKEFYIRKMMKFTKIVMGDSSATMNTKFRLQHTLSSNFYKKILPLLCSKEHNNIKESKVILCDKVYKLDLLFSNPIHFDFFAEYDRKNTIILDILECNPLNGVQLNNKKVLDAELLEYLKPYL